jgi:cytochrome c
MTPRFLLAATAMLTLSAAACGGPPEDVEFPEAEASSEAAAPVAAVPGAEPTVTPTPGATEAVPTPGATPTASASAAPTPAASASARPAAAAPAVAAGPPAAFAVCSVCHSVTPGQNMIGPSLAGVVGRHAGSAAGFSYSPAMKGSNVTWNDGNLERYLADPNAVVPGTTMPPPGVDAAQRRAIIAYLKTL